MKAIINVIMVLLSMIALILEKSSWYEILVVGLLFMILFELEKFRLKKGGVMEMENIKMCATQRPVPVDPHIGFLTVFDLCMVDLHDFYR